MDWLNYHHLLYFWAVAREGGIKAASERLRLSQPTISTQVRQLEERLGTRLFERRARKLQLTEAGRLAFRYADEIFGLGRELVGALQRASDDRPLRLVVGVTDVVHKLVAYRLIEPALHLPGGVRVECPEDKFERLLPRLAADELDLVLSDVPLTPSAAIKAFNHPLGRSEVSLFAAPPLAARLRRGLPRSLDRAPFLLPSGTGALRRELERWFDRNDIRPDVVGEFDDSALLKVFGQAGTGVFAGPTVVAEEIARQYKVQPLLRAEGLSETYYAISGERRLKHPGVVAISTAARTELFA